MPGWRGRKAKAPSPAPRPAPTLPGSTPVLQGQISTTETQRVPSLAFQPLPVLSQMPRSSALSPPLGNFPRLPPGLFSFSQALT